METEKILEKSKEVFRNCSLSNGAIIAADVNNPVYPKNVKWYGYVWLRDASFVCYACDLLKMYEISEKFFKWCLDYAEGLREGIFAHKYFPNGRIAGDFDLGLDERELKGEKRKIIKNYLKVKVFYIQFQPDQLGTLLWSIHEHSKFRSIEQFKELIEILANGICKYWKKNCFSIPSFDLWEENVALPKYRQVHVYSLTSCIKGLECALKFEENENWKTTLKQMKRVFLKCLDYSKNLGYIPRVFGKKIDTTIDSSLLTIAWPWEQLQANNEIMIKTIENILKENEFSGGILRYKCDRYNGQTKLADLSLGGGGVWPILNYWTSIYFCLKGEKEKSLKYFNWVSEKSLDGYLSEQIKENKPASIIPLAWSHAMFIIALKFLSIKNF
jgi:GH15 family glucan-1,4-alpha-glucosidase